MQKRRGVTVSTNKDNVDSESLAVPAGGTDSVPSTPKSTSSSQSAKNGSSRRRKQKRLDAGTSLAFDPLVGLFVLFMMAGVIILVMRLFGAGGRTKSTAEKEQKRSPEQGHRRLLPPLYNFDSLQYPLHHSQLVGLYFAASWCSMSTPVTRMLDEYYGSILMSPPTSDSQEKHKPRHLRPALSIVYVSSDKTETELKEYVKPNWFVVPFDSTEKSDLKRHFSVCARVELAELEMERKFEIPTLIILDGQTQGVLTTSGVQDLYHHGEKAIDYWTELLHKMREMQGSYQ